MLNAQLIGSYISNLRKEKDLTQVELADRLKVSHQAVSKWERGDSLPDIGTLYELSKVFGKTVDHILSGGKNESIPKNVGVIIKELAEQRPENVASLMNNGEADVDGFVALAPVLKTSTMRKVTEKMDENKFTLENIIQLAPFLEEDILSSFVAGMDTSMLNWDRAISLAPFLNEKVLGEILSNMEEAPELRQIIRVAPFADDILDELINKADFNNVSWQDISSLAPFLEQDTLAKLIEKLEEDEITFEQLKGIAPFIHKETLDHLVDKIPDNEFDLKELKGIVPFISREKLDHLLENAPLRNLSPSIIADIAPFVKKETLTKLMGRLVK